MNSSKAVRHGAPRKYTVAWGAHPKPGGCLGFGRPGSRPEVPVTPFRGFRPFVRPSHGTRERLCSPDSHCEVVRVSSQRKRLAGRSGSEQRSVRCRDARGQTRDTRVRSGSPARQLSIPLPWFLRRLRCIGRLIKFSAMGADFDLQPPVPSPPLRSPWKSGGDTGRSSPLPACHCSWAFRGLL